MSLALTIRTFAALLPFVVQRPSGNYREGTSIVVVVAESRNTRRVLKVDALTLRSYRLPPLGRVNRLIDSRIIRALLIIT